ncbi:Adenylate cyclase type 10 [Phlyctochytrium bullatum]|nr:Adenylate cyclase type 10 [Phlyctochytrium bullatum]
MYFTSTTALALVSAVTLSTLTAAEVADNPTYNPQTHTAVLGPVECKSYPDCLFLREKASGFCDGLPAWDPQSGRSVRAECIDGLNEVADKCVKSIDAGNPYGFYYKFTFQNGATADSSAPSTPTQSLSATQTSKASPWYLTPESAKKVAENVYDVLKRSAANCSASSLPLLGKATVSYVKRLLKFNAENAKCSYKQLDQAPPQCVCIEVKEFFADIKAAGCDTVTEMIGKGIEKVCPLSSATESIASPASRAISATETSKVSPWYLTPESAEKVTEKLYEILKQSGETCPESSFEILGKAAAGYVKRIVKLNADTKCSYKNLDQPPPRCTCLEVERFYSEVKPAGCEKVTELIKKRMEKVCSSSSTTPTPQPGSQETRIYSVTKTYIVSQTVVKTVVVTKTMVVPYGYYKPPTKTWGSVTYPFSTSTPTPTPQISTVVDTFEVVTSTKDDPIVNTFTTTTSSPGSTSTSADYTYIDGCPNKPVPVTVAAEIARSVKAKLAAIKCEYGRPDAIPPCACDIVKELSATVQQYCDAYSSKLEKLWKRDCGERTPVSSKEAVVTKVGTGVVATAASKVGPVAVVKVGSGVIATSTTTTRTATTTKSAQAAATSTVGPGVVAEASPSTVKFSPQYVDGVVGTLNVVAKSAADCEYLAKYGTTNKDAFCEGLKESTSVGKACLDAYAKLRPHAFFDVKIVMPPSNVANPKVSGGGTQEEEKEDTANKAGREWRMLEIETFVPSFVKELLGDEDARREMIECLNKRLPYAKQDFAAIAMIDVSGYSKLVSFLEESFGRMSSEVVTAAMEDYLGKIVALVVQHHGDIVKIDLRPWMQRMKALSSGSGRNVEEDLSSAPSRKHLDPVEQVFLKLTLHIAVTTGTIEKVIVGKPLSRMEYLAYGDFFKDLSGLLDEAASEAKRRDASGRISGKAVLHALRSEYRTVSVLFIKIHSPFTAQDAQRVFTIVFEEIERNDGVLHQYAVDDKGQVLLGCFGLPPFGQDKISMKAVLAATRICSSLDPILPRTSIIPNTSGRTQKAPSANVSLAITSGDVLFATVGADCRRDPTFLGDTINLAARLLGLNKKGKVLVDAKTAAAVSYAIELEDLGKFKVKGKANPIPVWAVTGTREEERARSVQKVDPFLHESEEFSLQTHNLVERKTIRQAVTSYDEGNVTKGIMVIQGESGMGKTKLLHLARGTEVTQMSSFTATRDFMLQLIQINNSHSLGSAFKDSLNSMASSVKLASDRQVRRADVEAVFRETGIDAGVLPSVLSVLRISAEEEGTFITGYRALERQRTTDVASSGALVYALASMAKVLLDKNKVALLCDDFQFLDPSSAEVLNDLIENTRHGLFFIFTRPTSGITAMYLDKLAQLEMSAFKCSQVDSSLLKAVFSASHGNLMQTDFIVQFLLADPNKLIGVDAKGRLTTQKSEELEKILSTATEVMVKVQLDGLYPPFRNLLRHASILGQYFRVDELHVVLSADVGFLGADGLLSMIFKYDRFHFLEVMDESGEHVKTVEAAAVPQGLKKLLVGFRHISIMNAIYECLAIAEKEQLHRKMALHVEEKLQLETLESEKILKEEDLDPLNDADILLELLPKICFHITKTTDFATSIMRTAELGLLFLRSGLYREASRTLANVSRMIQEFKEGIEIVPSAFGKEILTPLFQCKILAARALVEGHLQNIKPASEFAIHCLNLSGLGWPTKSTDVRREILKALRKITALWVASRNLKKDVPYSGLKYLGGTWKEQYIIFHKLFTVMKIPGFVRSVSPQQILLINLWGFCHAIYCCASNPKNLMSTIMGTSLICYYLGGTGKAIGFRLSKKFFQIFQKHIRKSGEIVTQIPYWQVMPYVLYGANIKESLIVAGRIEKYLLTRRDPDVYGICAFPCIVGIFCGDIESAKSCLAFRNMDEYKARGHLYWHGAISFVQIPLFLLQERVLLEKFSELQKEVVDAVPKDIQLRIAPPYSSCRLFLVILDGGPFSTATSLITQTLTDLSNTKFFVSFPSTFGIVLPIFIICMLPSAYQRIRRDSKQAETIADLLQKSIARYRPIEKHSFPLPFTNLLLRAALACVSGKQGAACVACAKGLMRRKEYRRKLVPGGDLYLLAAICCGIVAFLSENDMDRRAYRKRALEMFRDMKATVMERWLSEDLSL